MTALRVAPISLRQANAYVERVHRHHGPTRGMRFAVGVVDERGELRGVGIAGRPVSRVLDAAGYLEVTRVATDGARNACSMIYGSLRRAALALGYRADHVVTYTLGSETGTSLRASGWVRDGDAGGGSWSRDGRERTDKSPTERKVRWLAGRESSSSEEATKAECGRTIAGTVPAWAGSDQIDPCTCVLGDGHAGAHRCSHDVAESSSLGKGSR